MGLVIKWDITYKCNLFCEHCINGNFLEKNPDELAYEDVIRIIDNITASIAINRIHFLGGEPLTRPDFIDILKYLDYKGIKFGFNTNGLLFAGDNMAKICSLKNLDSVVLSIEGPTAEVNDTIRGKNVFNILIDRLKKIQCYRETSDFKVVINNVLMKTNYRYIEDMVKLCAELKVDKINFLEFIEEGNGQGRGLALSREEFIDAVNTIAEVYSKNYDVEIVPKFTRPMAIDYAKNVLGLDYPMAIQACGAGSNSVFIDNHGVIYNCDRDRNNGGKGFNLLLNSFKDIWDDKYFTTPFSIYQSSRLYKGIEPCQDCKYLYKECFPCHIELKKNKLTHVGQCALFKQLISEGREGEAI